MKPMSFSSKRDKKLIMMVQEHPVLYNSKHENFKNNKIKDNLWIEISTSMGINAIDCKTRWRTIRNSYRKKYKKALMKSLEAPKSKSKYDDDTLRFLNDIAIPSTLSDSSIKVETTDNVMGSEVENETLVCTEKECPGPITEKECPGPVTKTECPGPGIEMECPGLVTETEYPGPVTETINTSVDEPQMKLKKVKEVKEIPKKSKKNPKTRGKRDQTIKEIGKGQNKQLAELKEKELADYEHPNHIFFKCLAATVMAFSPHLVIETKMRICNIIYEMELRSLALQNYPPPMNSPMTSEQAWSTQENVMSIDDENLKNSDYNSDCKSGSSSTML